MVFVVGKIVYFIFKDFWVYFIDIMDWLKDLNVECIEFDNIFDIEEEEKIFK